MEVINKIFPKKIYLWLGIAPVAWPGWGSLVILRDCGSLDSSSNLGPGPHILSGSSKLLFVRIVSDHSCERFYLNDYSGVT